jgi:IclR family transcriptional regulator, acetate operon repressor
VKVVLTALSVLEGVAEQQPIGVSELARALGLPKTTVYRSLQTLHEAGWLALDVGDPPRWRLSYHTTSILRRHDLESSLREAALPVMQGLRDETGETVFLAVLQGSAGVVVERADGTKPVRTYNRIGARVPLHAAASGQAILAFLSREQQEDIIALGLEEFSETTVTNPEALRAELTIIRERGYSINMSAYRPDVVGFGAAVLDRARRPLAGLSVSVPASRFTDDLVIQLGTLIHQAADEIGRHLDPTVLSTSVAARRLLTHLDR